MLGPRNPVFVPGKGDTNNNSNYPFDKGDKGIPEKQQIGNLVGIPKARFDPYGPDGIDPFNHWGFEWLILLVDLLNPYCFEYLKFIDYWKFYFFSNLYFRFIYVKNKLK